MKKIKYLHIMHNDKFIAPYIEFINENFRSEEHFFLIIDGFSKNKIPWKEWKNTFYCEKITLKNKILKMYQIINFFIFINTFCKNSEKIYFHSLFGRYKILFLFIFRKYLKKSYWIIWGGDLYCYRNRKKGFLREIYYKIENYVKGNFYGYISEFKGDYKLAQKWFGVTGKYIDCFEYPSNLYKELKLDKVEKNGIYIQIGNSADPTNNHFEILKKLEKYKEEKIKIYCPLSYGDTKYAAEVIKKGKGIFKEKFIPMIEFLDYQRYLEFLSQIDIAIFAHDRQQAFGNITSLLGMKKTIYLKERVTTYYLLQEIGIKVKSFDKLEELEIFEEKILEQNKNIVKERFSKKKLIEEWKVAFNS